MEIRDGRVEDAAEASRLYALSWKETYRGKLPDTYLEQLREDFWQETFQKWIETGEWNIRVAAQGGRILAAAVYGRSQEEGYLSWGEIKSLYVLPGELGKGYGKALFTDVCGLLAKQGFDCLYLWVLKENARARSFYERQGFRATEDELNCYFEGEPYPDVRYIRKCHIRKEN
ncbi:GNAT family N-acetyltransferase [Anaerolentibacter hominis]|uniref:GNAT family N-acetyltransferase n=1 Tax=Anaerolentibacter hominis TaxID=3079009 RepID=UPI0031B8878C